MDQPTPQEVLQEIVAAYEADGLLLRRTEKDEPVLRAPIVSGRATVSPGSVPAKQALVAAAKLEWFESAENRIVRVPLSDETPDRHRTIILADGWDFTAWRANPVLLAQHESWELPIGHGLTLVRSRNTGPDGQVRKGWATDALFLPAELNPRAEVYFRNWMAGAIRMSSVGFIPRGYRKITLKEAEKWGVGDGLYVIEQAELAELSIVTIGSNPSMVAKEMAVACVRAIAAGNGGQHPVFGRAELVQLYGAEAVEAAGVELPDHSEAGLSASAIEAAAGRIRAAIAEPIVVDIRTVEKLELEPEPEAAPPADPPQVQSALDRALAGLAAVRELVTAEGGPAAEASDGNGALRVVQVDGIDYVPKAALDAARVQRSALALLEELLRGALAATPESVDDTTELVGAPLARLLGSIDGVMSAVEELRAEVEQLRSAAPVALVDGSGVDLGGNLHTNAPTSEDDARQLLERLVEAAKQRGAGR